VLSDLASAMLRRADTVLPRTCVRTAVFGGANAVLSNLASAVFRCAYTVLPNLRAAVFGSPHGLLP